MNREPFFTDNMPRTYSARVLGCKVNQYELYQMEELLRRKGFCEAETEATADVLLVHGCAVTGVAAAKSRQLLRRLHRSNPEALLIMSGCGAVVPDFHAEEEGCFSVAPGEDLLVNLEQVLNERFGLAENYAENADLFPAVSFGRHTRAYLKIQDGCSIGCSYCIVPSLRGGSRDKPLSVILEEAEALVRRGYREVVVAGVSVGLYGSESGVSLPEVLQNLIGIAGLERIRMSSLHPQEVTDELLAVWRSSEKMMPHVHLPLQSGSTAVLKAMRRGHTAEDYLSAVDRFKAVLDRPAFTTDVITGFPGETEADFEQTCAVAEAVGFLRMHIFPYSARPGTLAAKMEGRVRSEIAAERAAQLKQLGAVLARQVLGRFGGGEESVLFEKQVKGNLVEGHGARYFRLQAEGGEALVGQVARVRLCAGGNSEPMMGSLVEGQCSQ